MLFVSASNLSATELALLGNNIRPGRRQDRHRDRLSRDERANRRVLAAVNRSLALHDERVERLNPPLSGQASTQRQLAS